MQNSDVSFRLAGVDEDMKIVPQTELSSTMACMSERGVVRCRWSVRCQCWARQHAIVCGRVHHRRVHACLYPRIHVLCGSVPGQKREPRHDRLCGRGSHSMLQRIDKSAVATMKRKSGGEEGARERQGAHRQLFLTMRPARCRCMLGAPMAAARELFLLI